MSSPDITRFDPRGPLLKGVSLLEASAGTGKTYNITNLVVRLVAEHAVPMRAILVVTFTRAATAELKDRVRRRLGEAVAALRGEEAPEDEVLALLWERSREPGDHGETLRRLLDAQEAFDECLISTIHGFCQRMLQQNAFESGAAFGLELSQDSGPLQEELVDDWLSRELHPADPKRLRFHRESCRFQREPLLKLAEEVLRDPDMKVMPESSEVTEADWPALLARFRAGWDGGWAASLPDALTAAKAAKLFKKGERTYTRKNAEKFVTAMDGWLAGSPGPLDGDDLPKRTQKESWLDYWSASCLQAKLNDPDTPFEHPALEPIRELLAFTPRLAACRRAAFVAWLRSEFDARNASRGLQSFQDLMRRLAQNLDPAAAPRRREALVSAIGDRFQAALIDEFQDTDRLQWTIFSTLFGRGAHWLYLIGDPKQAIYGFRGANVHVYLQARGRADRTWTMTRNYRSDAGYVEALNHVMDRPGIFGGTRSRRSIDFVEVDTPTRSPAERLTWPVGSGDPAAPLQLRFLDQRIEGATDPGGSVLNKDSLDILLPRRVAADAVELLDAGVHIQDPEAPGGRRPLGPGDLAVLVRTGRQGAAIREALSEAGLPCILTGTSSVFASDAARDLELWLSALAQPGRDGPARCAATTRSFGRSGDFLLALDTEDPEALGAWERWMERLLHWRELLEERGFLRAFRAALEQEDVVVRLLASPDGERRLTNLLHAAELLHAAGEAERLRLTGLLSWLSARRAAAENDGEAEELRLERDDAAVRILTMHKSKGLQFPVVFAPFLWSSRLPQNKDPAIILPDPDDPTRRCIDLQAERGDSLEAARLESREETLRLAYVTMTRAMHRCIVYTGHCKDFDLSPLAAVLHGEPTAPGMGRLQAGKLRAGQGAEALEADLETLARSSGGKVAVSVCLPPEQAQWTPPTDTVPALSARDFHRRGLDKVWRRASYTALTRGKGVSYAAALDEEREGFDPDATELGTGSSEEMRPPRVEAEELEDVPLAAFPAGAHAGTFLHEIFEHADFAWGAPKGDVDAGRTALSSLTGELLTRHGFDSERWTDDLTDALMPVLATPLGGPLGELRLCDVPRARRFDELRFDFPIAGGDDHGAEGHKRRVRSEHLIAALQLRVPDERMRRPYVDGLGSLKLGSLAGFMTGSIDLVFQAPADAGSRWFVADYKSNRLDPHATRRWPIEHFDLAGMRYEMEQHHYYLQYHLYSLALHRYLGWRLGDDYDYDRDFGGIYYLFVRGMLGGATPREGDTVHGCFHDRPPKEVIQALDRCFATPPGPGKASS